MVVAKQIFKVDIDPAVADQVRKVFETRKIGYAIGTEMLFRWFCEQAEELQAAILGQLPESIRPDVARLLLERMAKKPAKFDIDEPYVIGGRQPAPKARERRGADK